MTTDRGIDRAAGRQHGIDDSEILPPDVAGLQGGDKPGVRRQVARHHHQAAGFLVEAVHNTGARQCRQVRGVIQQRIQQRPVRIARRGMHHQPRRFVNDQQVVILVDHVQCDCLCLAHRLHRDLGIDLHLLTALDDFTRLRHATIKRDLAGADPLLQPAAGIVRHQLGQRLVQPAATHGFRNADRQVYGLRHVRKCMGYNQRPATGRIVFRSLILIP